PPQPTLFPYTTLFRSQTALFLSDNCPVDLTNPVICPLHDLRRLPLVERQRWVAGLTLKDLRYLIQYHETCAIERQRSLPPRPRRDRKSTRLNSSHVKI